MTFSYNPPNASGVFPTPKDEVRFLSEDTVESLESTSDEEIAYLLSQFAVKMSAALAVERRAGKYSLKSSNQRSSKKVGDLAIGKVDYAGTAEYLYKLADQLRSGGVQNDGIPSILLNTGGGSPESSTFYIGQDDYAPHRKPRENY